MSPRQGKASIGRMANHGKDRPKFGEIAVAKGFCALKDVDQALRIQRDQDQKGERHRLLGIIMIEEGLLSTTQLIEILKDFEKAGSPLPPPGLS